MFLCPFQEFRNLAKDLGAGDAVLLQSLAGEPPRLDMIARIAGRDIRSRIETVHPDEFPEGGPAATPVAADVAAFLQACRTALPFVSEDPSRPAIAGIFWHEEKRALVATDGRRLTLLELPQFSLGCDLIIPASKVLANSILEGGEGTLGIAMEGERACLEIACGPWRYRERGIEGVYPNYRVVIPADVGQFVATVDIAPPDLALVRSAVARFTGDRTVAVCLCGVPGMAPYLADTVAADDGHTHVQLPHSRYTGGNPHGQAVNGRYFIECLEAGFLSLRLPSDCSPWLCTGEHAGVHCLMPMRDDTGSIVASVTAALNSEGKQTMTSRAQTSVPASAVGTETPADSSVVPGTAVPSPDGGKPPTGDATVPQLTIVAADPLQELRNGVADAEEALRQANAAVRSLREKTRAVERFIRDREKQFAKSEKVLGQLKDVVGF